MFVCFQLGNPLFMNIGHQTDLVTMFKLLCLFYTEFFIEIFIYTVYLHVLKLKIKLWGNLLSVNEEL